MLDPVARHGRTLVSPGHGPEVDLRISVDQPATIDEWLVEGRIDVAVTLVLEDDIGADDVMLSIDNLVWGPQRRYRRR